MKKQFTKFLTCILSLAMILSLGAVTVSAAESSEGELKPMESEDFSKDWTLETDETTGEQYWKLDAIYVKNPTVGTESNFVEDENNYVQHIAVYVPYDYMVQQEDGSVVINHAGRVTSTSGVVYSADNAPMIMYNHSGGYSSSTIQGVEMTWIEQGYVHVEVQTRGKATKNLDGEYIGQFPSLIVDMKASIKFLRHFDNVIPGDSEAIVSTGHSSGGAVSAMLGASGDASVFDQYFDEIGAYDESDAIYAAHASAPITNLSSADASYEWFQTANPTYFLFNSMAYDREGNPIPNFPVGPQNKYPLGANVLGGAFEDELSALLYDEYVEYVQSLGLDLGDDGRSGSFYDGFVEIYEEGLEELIARFDELKTSTKSSTLKKAIEGYDTVDEYLASINKTGWFTYDKATGEVTIKSLDDMVKNYITRKKMCPSLDSYNYKSNESAAFVKADGTITHFSGTVYTALKELLDDYNTNGSKNFTGMKIKDADGNYSSYADFTESDADYLKALVKDYETAGSEEDMYMLEVMSPVNYIVAEEGSEFYATSAQHWRIRNGSADGDHGAPAGWLIYEALQKYQPDVDSEMGIAWGYPHEWSELTDQDFNDYVDGIMLEDGKVGAFTDISDCSSGVQTAIKWAADNGIVTGYTDKFGDKTFEPKADCTRAQMAVMLYRLAGKPEVTDEQIAAAKAKFSDVSSVSSGALKAIAWAVSEGIISGYDDGTFKPEDSISRASTVVMLWRMAGKPEVSLVATFTDIADCSEGVMKAINWAATVGITMGSSNGDGTYKFAPNDNCQRQHIATFVYRYNKKVNK